MPVTFLKKRYVRRYCDVVLDTEFYEEGRSGPVNRDVPIGIIVDYIPVTYKKSTVFGAFPGIPVNFSFSGSGAERSVHVDYIPHAQYGTYILDLFDRVSGSCSRIRPASIVSPMMRDAIG